MLMLLLTLHAVDRADDWVRRRTMRKELTTMTTTSLFQVVLLMLLMMMMMIVTMKSRMWNGLWSYLSCFGSFSELDWQELVLSFRFVVVVVVVVVVRLLVCFIL